ncbi:tRNA lysidine(34) synthetase TilS [Sphingomonas sp. MMS24-J13]|uniref:tRNA lysidine(34) synthetase TilS n=1 Tax=Sphingomonas sp. MMS24-J13 TaxID=3238686 RepID=UPI00384D80D7
MLGGRQLVRFRAALDLLAPAGRIALAVSGGPDSLALLLLAHAARPAMIVAATVDHRLRLESREEARMVAHLCEKLRIRHAILDVDVADDPAGLQAAARMARYAALTRFAQNEGAIFLATAHHLDDQAETLLMRLARGSGVAGLSGVRRARPLDDAPGITLIRPLLDWRKAELEEIVAEARLRPVRDPSNHNPRFDRTRAREWLAQGWPKPEQLAAVANRLADAEEALAWTTRALAVDRLRIDQRIATLDTSGLPHEYRRRLVLAVFAGLVPGVIPRGEALDHLIGALDQGEIATLGGLRAHPGPPWQFSLEGPRRSV